MCVNIRVHPLLGPDLFTCLQNIKGNLKINHGRQFKNYQGGTTILDLPTKFTDTHVQRKIFQFTRPCRNH